MTELDIRSTVARVCYKVLHDHSVDEPTRLKRCKALLALGKLFLAHGGSTAAGLGDIKARLGQMSGGGAQQKPEEGQAPQQAAEPEFAPASPLPAAAGKSSSGDKSFESGANSSSSSESKYDDSANLD